MNLKYRIVGILYFICISFLSAGVSLNYLNTLRTQAGLASFSEQANLRAAAQNHSAYLQTNNVTGHYENSTKSGYTGHYGNDRAVASGYYSDIVSENVSYGSNATYKSSIDNLFSAIYHRFGFLTLTNDEIGIGVSNNGQYYTYDMGNSHLNSLCTNGVYHGGTYYLPCADTTQKISATDYLSATETLQTNAPDVIVWPASNSVDNPPVFYNETPDPLPSDSVTGYPVSVQFNESKFATAPTVSSFTIAKSAAVQLNTITMMNQSNDPNGRFSNYEYALFPTNRLEWGSRYDVELIYTASGTQTILNWCFITTTLQGIADRFYRIENNTNITLSVISNKSYAFYVLPNNSNDTLGGVSYSGNAQVSFAYIDSNTVKITLSGALGASVDFTFGNGQQLTTTIASSDTAQIPQHETCPSALDSDNDGVLDVNDAFPLDASESIDTDNDGIGNNADSDDDNDGLSDTIETAHGLNPLNASDAQADFDNDGFSNTIEISVGSDIRSAQSHPTWTPVIMGDIMIFIPSF